jgi:hypothetical protein
MISVNQLKDLEWHWSLEKIHTKEDMVRAQRLKARWNSEVESEQSKEDDG